MTNQTIIELLARREGRCTHDHIHWEYEVPEGDRELVCQFCKTSEITPPPYLSSIDALQPVLATLSEEELHDVQFELAQIGKSCAVEGLLTEPKDLALCIAKAIEKKGEE